MGLSGLQTGDQGWGYDQAGRRDDTFRNIWFWTGPLLPHTCRTLEVIGCPPFYRMHETLLLASERGTAV